MNCSPKDAAHSIVLDQIEAVFANEAVLGDYGADVLRMREIKKQLVRLHRRLVKESGADRALLTV